jgi:hypothetical protein
MYSDGYRATRRTIAARGSIRLISFAFRECQHLSRI